MAKPSEDRIASLGTEPISKLLIGFSIPAILSMVVEALYNFVDRYFVALGVGYLGVAGITLNFPISLAVMAFALVVGVGGNTLFSLRLGAKKRGQAAIILNNSIFLLIVIGIVVFIVGQIFAEPLLRFIGASDETLPYALDYLRIVLFGSLFQTLTSGLNNFIRSMGYPKAALVRSFVGAVVNIALDWLFIMKFGWGIKGAAWATVIAQFCAWVAVLTFFFRKETQIRLNIKQMKLQMIFVRRIVIMGLPSGLLHFFNSAMNVILNKSLGYYGNQSFYGGDMAISAYGIIHSVITLVGLPLLGMVQAMQPLIGYNYGYQRYDRVRQTLKYGLYSTITFALFAWVIFHLFPYQIVGVFAPETPLLRELAGAALQISSMMLPLMAFGMISGNFFQGIGKPMLSLTINVFRQVLMLIPMLLIIPRFFGLNGVFMATPCSEFFATIVIAFLLRRELCRMREKERAIGLKSDALEFCNKGVYTTLQQTNDQES